MFDSKTAQACWSGPTSNEDPYAKFGGRTQPGSPPEDIFDKVAKDLPQGLTPLPQNQARLPFCKDLH